MQDIEPIALTEVMHLLVRPNCDEKSSALRKLM